MKRLCTTAIVILAVNGAALCTAATLYVLQTDISAGSAWDIPASVIGYYCALILPITSVGAVVILLRRSRLGIAGGVLLTLGILLLLANYSVLLEGHLAVSPVRDAEGNLRVDDTGNLINEVNPAYLEFKRQQFHRTILAMGMIAMGAVVLLTGKHGLRARCAKDAGGGGKSGP